MSVSYSTAKRFYHSLIDSFSDRYPRLEEESIGMVKVLHAFEDKIPLVDVLVERDLLLGGILKKSSSRAQPEIAKRMSSVLEENDLLMLESDTTYANAIPQLSRRALGRPFVLGDHGGYYGSVLPHIRRAFRNDLVGVTEHTLNGEEKISRKRGSACSDFPYISTARIDLKERSDREISYAIANEIIEFVEGMDKSIRSSCSDLSILLLGYGVMGSHSARAMKDLGCQAEIIVSDVSYKKRAFAVQDDYLVTEDYREVLPWVDIIVLATNVVKGVDPVFTPQDFSLMKSDVVITSMTSLDDEIRKEELLNSGTLTFVQNSQNLPLYRGPRGKQLSLMLDGSPANVRLPDGGSGESIYMVEAAGLAGAFVLAQNRENQNPTGDRLSEEDAELISKIWLEYFG